MAEGTINQKQMKKNKKSTKKETSDLYVNDEGHLVGVGHVVTTKPKKNKGAQGKVVIPYCKTC